MSRGRNLIASAGVALCVAAGLIVFPHDARAQVVDAARAHAISIQAPSVVSAGTEICFEVTCYEGKPSVGVECEEVQIPVIVTATHDPSVFLVCAKVPGGANGSSLVITAVSSNGSVATSTVSVH